MAKFANGCDNQLMQRTDTHTHVSRFDWFSLQGRIARLCGVCVCVIIPFILDVRFVDVPAGVTQEEDHTGFLIHLPSTVLALIFLVKRIQLFLSLVDREVELCVITI